MSNILLDANMVLRTGKDAVLI